jgi:hypothetical protein
VTASSPDGTTLTYSMVGQPPGVSIDPTSGLITGTIGAGAADGGPFTATVTASDGTYSASQYFNWDVSPRIDVTPIADQSNIEGDAVSLPVTASSPDGTTLTYSITGQPPGVSIDPSSGLISGTISAGAAAGGPYTTNVTATDGTYSASQTFNWSVQAAPVPGSTQPLPSTGSPPPQTPPSDTLKPDAPEPAAPTIQILDAVGNATTTLRVAKWENAFGETFPDPTGGLPILTIKDNFVDLDPDRFVVQVTDAAANKDPKAIETVTILLSTKNAVDAQHPNNAQYNETNRKLILTETGKNTGVFRSYSSILVSNKADDEYPITLNPTDARGVKDNDVNDRSFMIALGGQVIVTYGALTAQATVPVKKTLRVVINTLKKGGLAVTDERQLGVQEQIAREQYAQVGVDLLFDVRKPVDPPPGVTLGRDGLALATQYLDKINERLNISEEEKALFGDQALRDGGKPPPAPTVYVYYVDAMVHADASSATAPKGTWFFQRYTSGATYVPNRFPEKYTYSVLMSAKYSSPFALGHELGHALLNSLPGTQDHSNNLYDVMYSRFSFSVGTDTILYYKRFPQAVADSMLKNPLLKAPPEK